ncbi:hypothetical protein QL285_069235 [Trifolium repens]|nr:hypothetical protein QL285_069235 [Trifolium repens]
MQLTNSRGYQSSNEFTILVLKVFTANDTFTTYLLDNTCVILYLGTPRYETLSQFPSGNPDSATYTQQTTKQEWRHIPRDYTTRT